MARVIKSLIPFLQQVQEQLQEQVQPLCDFGTTSG